MAEQMLAFFGQFFSNPSVLWLGSGRGFRCHLACLLSATCNCQAVAMGSFCCWIRFGTCGDCSDCVSA